MKILLINITQQIWCIYLPILSLAAVLLHDNKHIFKSEIKRKHVSHKVENRVLHSLLGWLVEKAKLEDGPLFLFL